MRFMISHVIQFRWLYALVCPIGPIPLYSLSIVVLLSVPY